MRARPDTQAGGGAAVQTVRLEREQDVPRALVTAGVDYPRPTILLVGGAGRLEEDDAARIRPFLRDALVPLIERVGGAIVDGGTDSGVMQLIGDARATAGAIFPLVGVAAIGTVDAGDGSDGGTTPLEARHSVVFLVPGTAWGDESPWLHGIARALAGRAPVTLVVNGGPITLDEALRSAEQGSWVVAVKGTGRSADILARAGSGDAAEAEPRAVRLAGSGSLRVIDVGAGEVGLEAVVGPLLTEGGTR